MGSCESGPPLTEAEAKLNKQYIESIKAILHEEDYIDIKKEEKTFSYTNKPVILIQKSMMHNNIFSTCESKRIYL